MSNLPSFALFDLYSNVFLTVKHPTAKSACHEWGAWINNHNIAIIEVYGIKMVGQINPRTGRKLKDSTLDLAFLQSKYLPKQSAKYAVEPTLAKEPA